MKDFKFKLVDLTFGFKELPKYDQEYLRWQHLARAATGHLQQGHAEGANYHGVGQIAEQLQRLGERGRARHHHRQHHHLLQLHL